MATNDDDKPSFFARYVGDGEKGQQAKPEPEPDRGSEPQEPPELEAKAKVIQFPSTKKYLDPNTDIATLPLPLVRFPGKLLVIPDKEMVCNGWAEFIAEIAPETVPVIKHKKHVQYYISGTLKDAELSEAARRQKGLSTEQSAVGRARSGSHVATLGPGLLLDDDIGDVFAREPQLREFGAAALIYSSWSYGSVKEGAAEPSLGGRVALCANRRWTPAEHGALFDGFNHLLRGFDEHGRSPYLCYGRHATPGGSVTPKRLVIEGHAFNVDLLIELGRSLRPQFDPTRFHKTAPDRRYAISEELERMKLMGRVRPPDGYGEWMSCAGACKRAFPDDMDTAFACYDTWSACSSKYEGSEATARKFDRVSAEYEGEAIAVTLDMLHWRARRRAEKVIRTVYFPKVTIAEAFKDIKNENLDDGMPRLKGDEPIPPGAVGPKDAATALGYLLFCWSERVIEGLRVPPNVLDEARKLARAKHRDIDLDGRRLHRWNGGNIAAGTDALADDFLEADPKLYGYDKTNKVLVRLASPASDPVVAARIRELHGYKGKPGDKDDPAQGKALRLIPLLSADKSALRAFIAKHLAREITLEKGKGENKVKLEIICSFEFKSNAKSIIEPDAGVLDDLLRRVLPERAPEIKSAISAPLMLHLPASTTAEDLLQFDAVATSPPPRAGVDDAGASGTTVSVPFMITKAQKKKLRARGYSTDAIVRLTPQQAQEILNRTEE